MGFGLFKKKASAGLVLINGCVHTMDPDDPRAEAVACAGGKIIAAGSSEDMKPLISDDTEIVDLEGRHLTPGWIDLHSDPIPQVFKGQYLPLAEGMTIPELICAVSDYVASHPSEDRYLAYGYDPGEIKEEDIPVIREALHDTAPEKPLILVASDGFHMILNGQAAELAAQEAEELGMPAVTPALVTSLLLSADISALLDKLDEHTLRQAQRGVTTEFVLPSFSHFENIVRELLVDAYQADLLRQRYQGSLLVNAPLPERLILHQMAQKHTACAELKGMIQFRTLFLCFSGREGCSHYMSEAYLRQLCELVADKGHHIRVKALDRPAALTALRLMSELKTSYRRSAFTVEHQEVLTEEERAALLTAEIYECTGNVSGSVFSAPGELLESMTLRNADRLGQSQDCGSITVGKWADLAVFEEDPESASFAPKSAWMTLLGGRVVWDSRKAPEEDWAGQIREAVFSFDEPT